ncbi:MAG: MarC family protein [Bdellovibrionota bacterium]
MTQAFLKSFLSLFVAIDLLGAVPIFIAMTRNMDGEMRRNLITKSAWTALGVGVAFIFAGQAIFNFLGITESDFRIAGGLLLLIFSIRDLMSESGHEVKTDQDSLLGIVPIGIPLVMGPAALATLMLSAREYGLATTLVSLFVNMLLVWLAFRNSDRILRVLGEGLSQALAKIFSLLLAAIAVMMIRLGIMGFLN